MLKSIGLHKLSLFCCRVGREQEVTYVHLPRRVIQLERLEPTEGVTETLTGINEDPLKQFFMVFGFLLLGKQQKMITEQRLWRIDISINAFFPNCVILSKLLTTWSQIFLI